MTTDPGVRFYAGAPLRTPDGHAIGTLCVSDQTPRTLRPEQREALAALGRLVMQRIEARRLLAKAAKVHEPRDIGTPQELANAVAHELATPLTSMMLEVRGLRRIIEHGSPEQRVRALDVVERNVNRLGDAAARIVQHATRMK